MVKKYCQYKTDIPRQLLRYSSDWVEVTGYIPDPAIRCFGLEIELEGSFSYTAIEGLYAEFLDNAKLPIMVVHDGTISGGGVEIVTPPVPYKQQLEVLKRIYNYLDDNNIRYRTPSNCGLHVHVSKSTVTLLMQHKIRKFLSKDENARYLEAIAKRKPNRWCSTDSLNIPLYTELRNVYNEGGNPYGSSKYQGFNIKPKHTVEFRLFKAASNYEDANKCLTWVHDFLIWINQVSMKDLSYRNFVQSITKKIV